jgi:FAD binding domain
MTLTDSMYPFAMPEVIFLGSPKETDLENTAIHQIKEQMQAYGDFQAYPEGKESLTCYQSDAQQMHQRMPLGVFKPSKIQNIAPFVKACRSLSLSYKIRCGGTGLYGSTNPSDTGLVLLTGHFRKIIEYDPINGFALVEAGVTANQLNQLVKRDGWEFPLKMQSAGIAGLAGCLSSNASPYQRRDFVLLDWIIEASLINREGQELTLPSAVLCGAEGAFGVITQLKVKLARAPEVVRIFQMKVELSTLLEFIRDRKCLNGIVSLEWYDEAYPSLKGAVLRLEGEAWRVKEAESLFNSSFQMTSITEQNVLSPFHLVPPGQTGLLIESGAILDQLEPWIVELRQLASTYSLGAYFCVQCLDGRVFMMIHWPRELPESRLRVAAFLKAYKESTMNSYGRVLSIRGVGEVFRRWDLDNEENRAFYKKLKRGDFLSYENS